MAGNSIHNLACQFSASASRLKANINSVIEKYDRHFEDDDLISLASMSINRFSSKGTLKKIKKSHAVGTSNLKTTKRKDELLKLKLGPRRVDLNVSRAIERECASALTQVENTLAPNEPSDAETLSSFDEDKDDFDSDDEDVYTDSWDGEEDRDLTPLSEVISNLIDDKSCSSSFDSSRWYKKHSNIGNGTATLFESSDSEDSCRDEVDGTTVCCNISKNKIIGGSGIPELNCTYNLDSSNGKTQFLQDTGSEIEATYSTLVTFSSPRPKIARPYARKQSKSQELQLLTKSGIVSEDTRSKVDSKKLPHNSETGQIHKGKNVPVENVIKYDGLFKNPQGIKIRRIAPVPLVSTPTLNHVSHSLEHSSNSSGFSSGGSISRVEKNFKAKMESLHSDNNFHSVGKDGRKPITHHQENYQEMDNSVQVKARRVDQWVDMVNMNSTMAKEPIHYSSCPPKIPKSFCPQNKQYSPKSSASSLSSDKHRNVGIQTTLNCTIRRKENTPTAQRTMKDASTLLSNSFLAAHSPRQSSRFPYNKMQGELEMENVSHVNNNQNIMFPEEYIYKFSPLNPNRVDSDYTANLHQDLRMRPDFKCFRPRRNEKRGRDEAIPDESSYSPRRSKFSKYDQTPESCNQRSPILSPRLLNGDNGTYVIHPAKCSKASKESFCSSRNRCKNSEFHQHCHCIHLVPHISECISMARKMLNDNQQSCSKSCCVRASTPLCSDACENNSSDFINSTFSDIGDKNNSIGGGDSLVSPKLGVFLNSSRSLRSNDILQSGLVEKEENEDISSDSINSRTYYKNPDSYLSPVKVKSHRAPSPNRAGLQNHFHSAFARGNNDNCNESNLFASLPSPFRDNQNRQSEWRHEKMDRNKVVLSRTPVSRNPSNTPLFSLQDYYMMEESDDTGHSESFVKAHAPKPKVLQKSHHRCQNGNSFTLKGKASDNGNFLGTKFSENSPPPQLIPTSTRKKATHNHSFLEILGLEHYVSSLTKKKEAENKNEFKKTKYRVGVEQGQDMDHQKDNNQSVVEGSPTEGYSLSEPLTIANNFNDVSVQPLSFSEKPVFDDTLSTINGSDEQNYELDSSIEDVSPKLRRKQVYRKKEVKPSNHPSSSTAKQLLSSHDYESSHCYNANSKQHKKLHRKVIKSIQPPAQHKTDSKRGWKSSVWESIAQQRRQTDRNRLFRASTPLQRDESTPLISLNNSLSTIVSHQDKEIESDSSDDDWETKTIGDVDFV